MGSMAHLLRNSNSAPPPPSEEAAQLCSLLERGESSTTLDETGILSDHFMERSPSTRAFVHRKLERQLLGKGYLDQSSFAAAGRAESARRQIITGALDVYVEGINFVVEDNFWKCFRSQKPPPWNWNCYLWPLWVIGGVVRYCIVFPFRLVVFALAWVLFGLLMVTVQGCCPHGERRRRLERLLISLMSGVFTFTWGAVIRYHGTLPLQRPRNTPCVYVANHTSMIDVIILQQMSCFSLVGQRHKGIVGFLQTKVLGCLECIWFDRGETRSRELVSRKLRDHAYDLSRNPLLVFPEGTCVNNEYCIQFKKGVFDLGVTVCPIAIKYNKIFVDPFWNSRKQSFVMHLVELMTSWCLICDVWYLEPQVKRPGEDSAAFAGRVKAMIAETANLKNVQWDGYMKYWKPSSRFLAARQKVIAERFKGILRSADAQLSDGHGSQSTGAVPTSPQGPRVRAALIGGMGQGPMPMPPDEAADDAERHAAGVGGNVGATTFADGGGGARGLLRRKYQPSPSPATTVSPPPAALMKAAVASTPHAL